MVKEESKVKRVFKLSEDKTIHYSIARRKTVLARSKVEIAKEIETLQKIIVDSNEETKAVKAKNNQTIKEATKLLNGFKKDYENMVTAPDTGVG